MAVIEKIVMTTVRILQIVRGGKVLWIDKALQIRWKTFAVRLPHQNVLTCVDYGILLIERICLIILNIYMVPLNLSLSDLGRYS